MSRPGNEKCCGAKKVLEVRFYGDARRLRINGDHRNPLKLLNCFPSAGKGERFRDSFGLVRWNLLKPQR